jgi:putative hydrolase of the HAD superfamily
MSERAIKVITFDLDNTLWDVEPALVRAEQAQNEWLAEHRPRVAKQFDDQQTRDFRIAVYRRNPQLAHQISELRIQSLYEMQLACGYDVGMAREGADSAFAAFLHYRHRVAPYERAMEVLDDLACRYVLGALTNGNADVFKTELGDHFDFAFSAEQLNASKPAPDLFHASLEETGARPEQVVHVGDNPEHDVHGAQSVGFHTIWMNSGGWRWPDQRQPADETITDIDQLPGAVASIEKRIGGQELS